MGRARSFVINHKGYCIVENKTAYSLYAPGKNVEIISLPQIKDILIRQIRSAEDAGVVNSVLSFFAGGRNNDFFYDIKRSRQYLPGSYRK